MNQVLVTTPEGDVLGGEVAGPQAFATWTKYRKDAGTTRLWPVLLGDDESLESLTDAKDTWEDSSASDIIARATRLDPEAWLAERARLDSDYYDPPRGQWPAETPVVRQYAVLYDFGKGQLRLSVKMALVRADLSWQVPAVLRYGGWNECPPPELHCALFRKWEQEYGAELVAMTGDTVEMAVSRPPRDREAALLLAREQFVYCPDVIYQGVRTLEALAAINLNGGIWYFWWD